MKSLILKADEVQAVLAGRKTQHRLLVRLGCSWAVEDRDDGSLWPGYQDEAGMWEWARCPLGKRGEVVWVKETWLELRDGHEHDSAKTHRRGIVRVGTTPRVNCVGYRADLEGYSDELRRELGYVWRSSAIMPRWASRLTLAITAVRVEREGANWFWVIDFKVEATLTERKP